MVYVEKMFKFDTDYDAIYLKQRYTASSGKLG